MQFFTVSSFLNSLLFAGSLPTDTPERRNSIFLFNSLLYFIVVMGLVTLAMVTLLQQLHIPNTLEDLNSYTFLLIAIPCCLLLLVLNRLGKFEIARQIALAYPILLLLLQFVVESETDEIENIVVYSILSRTRFIIFSLLFLIAIGKPSITLFSVVGTLSAFILLFFEELHATVTQHTFPETALGVLNDPSVRITFTLAYGIIALGVIRLHFTNASFSKKLHISLTVQEEKNKQLEEQKEEIDKINETLKFKQLTLQGSIETLNQQNQKIQQSINYASRIQKALLPAPEVLESAPCAVAIMYEPRDIVSGDFYWIHQENEHFWFCVADCTGHGIPGAFMSVLGMQLLNQIIKDESTYRPSAILNRLNYLLNETLSQRNKYQVRDGMDITLCYLNTVQQTFHLAAAKQSAVLQQNGVTQRIRGENKVIGQNKQTDIAFNELSVPLESLSGARVYLYSDGYQDQFGQNKGKFGSKPFRALLADTSHLPLQEQFARLKTTFSEWKGSQQQIDDTTIMGLEFA